ncbi:MAG: hypothetical protein ACK5NI_01550 [bacterium]
MGKNLKKIIFKKNFFKKSYNGKWVFGFKWAGILLYYLFELKKKVGTTFGSQNAKNSFSVG